MSKHRNAVRAFAGRFAQGTPNRHYIAIRMTIVDGKVTRNHYLHATKGWRSFKA